MICPYCGSEITENDYFCPYCDNYIEENNKDRTASSVKLCHSCQNVIPASAQFCPHCGKPFNQKPPQNPSDASNGFAIAGFVLSFFAPLLGLIFSCIGISKANKTGRGNGLATAGLILSIILLLLYISS